MADSYKVHNFDYNGFSGQLCDGDATYTAVLIEWTLDPGVGRFQCSDGKVRLIPTFALKHPHPKWVQPPSAPSGYSPVGYFGPAATS